MTVFGLYLDFVLTGEKTGIDVWPDWIGWLAIKVQLWPKIWVQLCSTQLVFTLLTLSWKEQKSKDGPTQVHTRNQQKMSTLVCGN